MKPSQPPVAPTIQTALESALDTLLAKVQDLHKQVLASVTAGNADAYEKAAAAFLQTLQQHQTALAQAFAQAEHSATLASKINAFQAAMTQLHDANRQLEQAVGRSLGVLLPQTQASGYGQLGQKKWSGLGRSMYGGSLKA